MILEELTEVLGLKINEAQWKAGERAVGGLKEGLAGLGEKSGLSGIIKAGLASFVGYEALNGVKEMISSVVELGSTLNDTAQKTGITVEGLQFFGYVAKLNSSNMEEMAGAAEKLAKGLADVAKTGSGPAADGLKAIGVQANSAAFKSANMDGKIQIIADHLAKLPDGAAKTAAAMDLFGRSGAQLIPTLNDLGKNGAHLRGEFGELGGALSGDNVKALDDFGDEIDKTKYSLTALKNSIVVALLPTLKGMLGSVQTWIKANKALIAQKVEKVLFLIADAAKFIGKALLVVIDALGFVQDHLQTLGPVIAAIVTLFNPWQVVIAGIIWLVGSLVAAFTEGKGPLAGFATWFRALIAEIKREIENLKETADAVWEGLKKYSGYNMVKRGVGEASDIVHNFASTLSAAPVAAGQAPSLPAGASAAPTTNTQHFSTPVTVNVNGGDPHQVKAVVKQAVGEALTSMNRQALNAVKVKP